MKNSIIIIMSILLLSVATGLTIGTASAATSYDVFAASTNGGQLPPCPSLFRCKIN